MLFFHVLFGSTILLTHSCFLVCPELLTKPQDNDRFDNLTYWAWNGGFRIIETGLYIATKAFGELKYSTILSLAIPQAIKYHHQSCKVLQTCQRVYFYMQNIFIRNKKKPSIV